MLRNNGYDAKSTKVGLGYAPQSPIHIAINRANTNNITKKEAYPMEDVFDEGIKEMKRTFFERLGWKPGTVFDRLGQKSGTVFDRLGRKSGTVFERLESLKDRRK